MKIAQGPAVAKFNQAKPSQISFFIVIFYYNRGNRGPSACLVIWLSACLVIWLSVCQSVCLPVCQPPVCQPPVCRCGGGGAHGVRARANGIFVCRRVPVPTFRLARAGELLVRPIDSILLASSSGFSFLFRFVFLFSLSILITIIFNCDNKFCEILSPHKKNLADVTNEVQPAAPKNIRLTELQPRSRKRRRASSPLSPLALLSSYLASRVVTRAHSLTSDLRWPVCRLVFPSVCVILTF